MKKANINEAKRALLYCARVKSSCRQGMSKKEFSVSFILVVSYPTLCLTTSRPNYLGTWRRIIMKIVYKIKFALNWFFRKILIRLYKLASQNSYSTICWRFDYKWRRKTDYKRRSKLLFQQKLTCSILRLLSLFTFLYTFSVHYITPLSLSNYSLYCLRHFLSPISRSKLSLLSLSTLSLCFLSLHFPTPLPYTTFFYTFCTASLVTWMRERRIFLHSSCRMV